MKTKTDLIDTDFAPLLAKAGILMFEYDAEGSLVGAVGSCLGGPDPVLEVRAGLVSPAPVRRALAGKTVMDRVSVAGRSIAVRHEPVRDADGRIERVVATAWDVSRASPVRAPRSWLASPSASSSSS